jgi:hypothetical protein
MSAKSAGPGGQIIYYILLGTLCSVILGYIFAGSKIFVTYNPEFQFILYGVIGSLLLAILKFRSLKDFILVSVIIFVLELLTYRFSSVGVASGRLIFMIGVAGVIYIYHTYFEKHISGMIFGKFVILAGLMATMEIVITILAAALIYVPSFKIYLLTQSFIGLLFGAGIGLGFELTAWSLKKK